MTSSLSNVKFINYPSPKQSTTSRRVDKPGSNPVVGGWLLVILSKLLSASTFLQKLLWRINKFDQIKDLPELEGYRARADPTVIPIFATNDINNDSNKPLALLELPKPRNRKSNRAYYTISDFHDAYVEGSLTPLDVAEYLLPLITREKEGRTANVGKYAVAYLDVQLEIVRTAARASTKRFRAGKPLSVLDGVPVAVKDEVNVKGHSKSLGSALKYTDQRNITDWCVAKWEEAGAIILGKTNMHEMGLDTTNNNPTWGTPLNPHNSGYYTGGSSGGSGCTAAQGIVPVALGVDGGGSVRIPSASCGLFGLKPSQSRVSTWPADVPVNSVCVNGPMGPSIDDVELAYRVMGQVCPEDPVNRMFPPTTTRTAIEFESPSRRYLGIDRAWVARSDPEVLKVFEAAVDHYKSLGYEIVDISIPMIDENIRAFSLTILAECMAVVKPENIKHLTHPNQILLNVSALHGTAQDLIAAQRIRDRAMRHLAWLWEQYPSMLILTPTLPIAGQQIRTATDVTNGYGISNADMSLRSMTFTFFANWTGVPAISCPVGYTEENVPLGIMAMGEWGSEEQLLRFGKEHESFLGEEGVRRPKGKDDWVDVLEGAKKR